MNYCVEARSGEKAKKSRVATPEVLIDGTICYTRAIRYPGRIMEKLRKLNYEKNMSNMTETIFFCIEEHKRLNLKTPTVRVLDKNDSKSLTIRFRESHFNYVNEVCLIKNLKTFSSGVIHILEEYFEVEERS